MERTKEVNELQLKPLSQILDYTGCNHKMNGHLNILC